MHTCIDLLSQKNNKTNKEFLLEKCVERNDDRGEQIDIQLEGAINYLYTANERYHHNCMQRFLICQCSLEGTVNLALKASTNDDTGLITSYKN